MRQTRVATWREAPEHQTRATWASMLLCVRWEATDLFLLLRNFWDDRQLNVGWTAGLPRVNCQFGFSEVVTCEPIVIVTPKGGTCEDALEKILELALLPLYAHPDSHRLHSHGLDGWGGAADLS